MSWKEIWEFKICGKEYRLAEKEVTVMIDSH